MDIFDELNENGEKTGRRITREEAHKLGLWHNAAVLFVINEKEQVVLQKRSLDKPNWPGKLDVSSGGHTNAGEETVDTAIRELLEELEIEADPKDVKVIGRVKSQDREGGMTNNHFNNYFIVTVENLDVKKLKFQKGEVDSAVLIDYPELKQLINARDDSLTSKWEAWDAFVDYIEKCKSDEQANRQNKSAMEY